MSNYQSTKIIYHKIYKQLQQNHWCYNEHFLPTLEDTKQHLQLINIDVMLHYFVYHQHQKYLTLYTNLHSTKNSHLLKHTFYHYSQRQINLLHYNDNQLPNDNLQDSKYHMTDFVYLIQHQEDYSLPILYNNENLRQMSNSHYLKQFSKISMDNQQHFCLTNFSNKDFQHQYLPNFLLFEQFLPYLQIILNYKNQFLQSIHNYHI